MDRNFFLFLKNPRCVKHRRQQTGRLPESKHGERPTKHVSTRHLFSTCLIDTFVPADKSLSPPGEHWGTSNKHLHCNFVEDFKHRAKYVIGAGDQMCDAAPDWKKKKKIQRFESGCDVGLRVRCLRSMSSDLTDQDCASSTGHGAGPRRGRGPSVRELRGRRGNAGPAQTLPLPQHRTVSRCNVFTFSSHVSSTPQRAFALSSGCTCK